MKEEMNNKKQLLLSIGLVLILVLMIVGISYAAFKFTGTGKKENTITTGAITMKYTESTNTISMNNALPTTDATGKVRLTAGEYFDFTLEGTIKGSENINWEIAAEDVTTASRKIDGKYIKLYLTSLDDNNNETEVMEPTVYTTESSENTYTGRPTGMMSLAKGSTSTSFSTKYRLRMYVDESYNPQGDGGDLAFSVKINAYGKTGNVMPKTGPVANVLLSGVGDNGTIDTSDSEQTFITGTDPNNYIWYSGKLWRAVSIDPSDNSVKLVTQWNISSLPYNAENNTAFKGSYMEQWLNDTSVDGFLGNLRESDKFIKTDSVWNATSTYATTKPEKTTMVTDAVGLLNIYEYTMSYKNATYLTGYLNNSLWWWTLTPYSSLDVRRVDNNGRGDRNDPTYSYGPRPSINLKSAVKIIDGDGTVDNPYRLQGDNDNPTGALLSTRYSGEYISFGTGENNLYRIVSHENGTGTKITSATQLKDSGSYKELAFGANVTFSKDNTIGTFLNGDYLTSGTYLTSAQVNMIEDNTTWYLGTVGDANYKLAKYQDATGSNLTTSTTTAKVGLLRLGELMAGQFDKYGKNTTYWTLTPYSTSYVRIFNNSGIGFYHGPTGSYGSRPSMNLKSNVVITGGKGTKEEPFSIKLGS
ncbi:MAG: DUF6273 domain-containing protein [Clostridium sp.]|nr:DUF6273 domain-containing protein [Clostridium sp.]